MDHQTQIDLVNQLLGHVSSGSTSRAPTVRERPAADYVCPEILDLERERIFGVFPLVAGLSVDVPEPGSFTTQDLAGVPTILVRGRDGHARAFLNACRHRGTRLVNDPCGSKQLFHCPFHAWTYDLDGRLTGIPRRDSFGDVDEANHGLIELPLVEKHGIIWVKVVPGPKFDVDDHLGGLGAELAGWHLGTQFPIDTRALRRRMNWKLANDTFGETYHFEILHRNTLNPAYYSNVTAYETFGRNHRMVFAARTIDELRLEPVHRWQLRDHATIAYFLFPNTQLLISPRSVELYRLFPSGTHTDRSLIYQSVYLERAPRTENEQANGRRILELLDTVIVGEDFGAAEAAQSALSSGLLPTVAYGRNEPALQHYHDGFREVLGERPS